jgi:DNA-directed RNA polymerase specialized sigma24 family protein
MASYKEQYYNLEEEEMQALILEAKKGSTVAQEELLKVFNNFLTKYVTMLHTGKYSYNDYDIRRFISLFVKDTFVRYALMKNKLNQAGYKHVNECINGILYMVKRYCSEEDIQQTIRLTFFQCITRYEKKDSDKGPIPFSAFLYSYFLYLLKKNVDTMLINQLGRKSFPLITQDDLFNDGESEDSPKAGAFVDTEEYANIDTPFNNDVDEFWVLGDSVNDLFQRLTLQERQLLKWRYIDGQRSSEIAIKITEHPNTVREHLTKIRDKISTILEEPRNGRI